MKNQLHQIGFYMIYERYFGLTGICFRFTLVESYFQIPILKEISAFSYPKSILIMANRNLAFTPPSAVGLLPMSLPPGAARL